MRIESHGVIKMKKIFGFIKISGVLAVMACTCLPALYAGEAAEGGASAGVSQAMFTINNLWLMISTFLVFIMSLGFACVETGLTRAKNCTNILFKNLLVPGIGILAFALVGFNLMFPGDSWIAGKFFGFSGLWLNCPAGDAGGIGYANGNYTYWTYFLFQAMFAATAATIVSGAVAERIKLHSFLLFTLFYVALVYPLLGSWGWGGGWLDALKFHDFAGSTFVHSVGGWGALAGVILLGPRIGKYVNGRPIPIFGHNMPLAVIGVFMLWFGWYGFNGGSVLNADPMKVSLVFVTTTLGAVSGMVAAMFVSWGLQGKPDLSMALNGCLAGLVGITAGADCISPSASILVGGIAGALAVGAVLFFDKFHLDDPVGALSVHLVGGVWGTVAVGIFSPDYALIPQLIGVAAVGVASFASAMGIFYVIKKTVGLRVDADEELRGLDIGEHGMEAYGGFQIFTTQ